MSDENSPENSPNDDSFDIPLTDDEWAIIEKLSRLAGNPPNDISREDEIEHRKELRQIIDDYYRFQASFLSGIQKLRSSDNPPPDSG